MASNFLVSIILGTSLQNLWGAINVLQIVFFMGMIPIRHAANLDEFYVMLSSLLQIDLITFEENTKFDHNPNFFTDNTYFNKYGFESNV